MAERPGADGNRFSRWLAKNSPTREELIKSRWLKPFAHRIAHSELWRFTRRSVPRGVALGLFVGIFLLIPGVQIIGVALLALTCRANIPLAAGMTFLSNPVTTPVLILPASIWIGNGMLGMHADLGTFKAMMARGASVGEWTTWVFSDVALGLIVGLFVLGVICAAVGYVLSAWIWRWWVGTKHRARLRRMRANS